MADDGMKLMGRALALKKHLDLTWMNLDEMISRRQLCFILSSNDSHLKEVMNVAWNTPLNLFRAWRLVSQKSKTTEQLLAMKCFCWALTFFYVFQMTILPSTPLAMKH
jgi:hypothetical protein